MNSHEHLVPNTQTAIIRGWKGITKIVPKSRAQIWRDIAAGLFPEPIDLGPNSIGWPQAVIEKWLASRPHRHYGARAAMMPDAGEADTADVAASASVDINTRPTDLASRPALPRRRGRPRKAVPVEIDRDPRDAAGRNITEGLDE